MHKALNSLGALLTAVIILMAGHAHAQVDVLDASTGFNELSNTTAEQGMLDHIIPGGTLGGLTATSVVCHVDGFILQNTGTNTKTIRLRVYMDTPSISPPTNMTKVLDITTFGLLWDSHWRPFQLEFRIEPAVMTGTTIFADWQIGNRQAPVTGLGLAGSGQVIDSLSGNRDMTFGNWTNYGQDLEVYMTVQMNAASPNFQIDRGHTNCVAY